MILPGATLGVLGGGQLGRMFTLAAHSMGYRVVVLDPDPRSPAGLVASQHIQAGYTDHAGLQMLGDECAAVTTEFENVPADSRLNTWPSVSRPISIRCPSTMRPWSRSWWIPRSIRSMR